MAEPLQLFAGHRQLFLDDYIIESMKGVRRTLNVVQKDFRNPILVPDKPWEPEETVLFGSVIQEACHRWRMWYLTSFHLKKSATAQKHFTAGAYAESKDGIYWRKPTFDIENFNGMTTNWVLGQSLHAHFSEFHGVIKDDTTLNRKRLYKTVFHTIPPGDTGRRYFTACSQNGIRWGEVREIPTQPPIVPDIGKFTYDSSEKKYVLWARCKYAPDEVRRRAPKGWFGRAVSLLTSSDFLSWENHGVVMAPDIDDPPGTDIYSLTGIRYGDIWIGLVQVYHQSPENHVLEIQLAHSRDGRRWTRFFDRKPILPVGDIGEWDRFNQTTGSNIVQTGDEIRLYYSGRTYRHPGYKGTDTEKKWWSGIGLASLRMDGFVSLDASFSGGLLITKPLKLTSPALFLNVKAEYGNVQVEALDMKGKIIAKSNPLSVNSVRTQVKWTKAADSLNQRLIKQPVRLRLSLQNARLYAFWCE